MKLHRPLWNPLKVAANRTYKVHIIVESTGLCMIQVNEDSSFERVSGTNLGGGTFWGLGRLLTKCAR
jgi:pantothenate kinase